MGVPICSCDSQYTINNTKNSSIFCCKRSEQLYDKNYTVTNNINDININNNYNILNQNKNLINDNLMKTEEKNIFKKNYKNKRNYENHCNSFPFYNDLNANFSTYSLNQNNNNILKDENYIHNIIKIQSYFRMYIKIKKKKLKENLEKTELKKKEKEEEKNKLNLKWNVLFSETTSSNDVYNSKDNIMEKKSFIILSNNLLNSSIENTQFPFNIKNKKNLYYKYSGYTKLKNSSENDDFNSKQELIKEGFGKMVFNDGSEFCGFFHNNVLKGYGKYSKIGQKNNANQEEKVIIITEELDYEEFIGEYKDYIPNGFGIYKNYLTNLKITGIFFNNDFSGIGIEESGEGGYIYQGDFVNNKKEGYGTMIWKDGLRYWGQFKNNQMNGYGIIEYPEKKYYQGEIKDGRMEGFGEFFWKRNKKYIGNYKNDKRNGFGIFIFKGDEDKKIDQYKAEISPSNNSSLNGLSAFIGFWKDGNMHGFGIKISKKEIKYGIWEKGVKKKWFENALGVKNYLSFGDKRYNKLYLSSISTIINFLEECINIDKDILPYY